MNTKQTFAGWAFEHVVTLDHTISSHKNAKGENVAWEDDLTGEVYWLAQPQGGTA